MSDARCPGIVRLSRAVTQGQSLGRVPHEARGQRRPPQRLRSWPRAASSRVRCDPGIVLDFALIATSRAPMLGRRCRELGSRGGVSANVRIAFDSDECRQARQVQPSARRGRRESPRSARGSPSCGRRGMRCMRLASRSASGSIRARSSSARPMISARRSHSSGAKRAAIVVNPAASAAATAATDPPPGRRRASGDCIEELFHVVARAEDSGSISVKRGGAEMALVGSGLAGSRRSARSRTRARRPT